MHTSSGSRRGKRNMNFELNLIPFIDVLSVCICFLLVTAIFINLGSFHVNQAIGTEGAASKDKKIGTVSVSLGENGAVRFEVKDVSGLSRGEAITTVSGTQGMVDFKKTEEWIKSFASRFTDVKTVLLMPSAKSKYDELIQLMAQFKGQSMDQIGIAPL